MLGRIRAIVIIAIVVAAGVALVVKEDRVHHALRVMWQTVRSFWRSIFGS